MATTRRNVRGKAVAKALEVRSIAPIPIEWMGPAAWRLPSGRALAEFALQSGFLAPLMLGDGPFWRRKSVDRRRADSVRPTVLGAGGNGLEP